jgi:hypothetical protein
MAESLDLTTPVVESKTTDIYAVVNLSMDSEMLAETPIPPGVPVPGFVTIAIKDNNGVRTSKSYTGVLAQNMIKFINTGDFTVRSLHRRILEKLSADGVLVGSVVGTPDPPTAGSPTGLE